LTLSLGVHVIDISAFIFWSVSYLMVGPMCRLAQCVGWLNVSVALFLQQLFDTIIGIVGSISMKGKQIDLPEVDVTRAWHASDHPMLFGTATYCTEMVRNIAWLKRG
jgi:hypothetical protein